uniref:TIR domain-containing protein n=1 Tax=Panagrellus redivivus TaxID=6233 RepID=A0A7E4VPJ6_PANRE
MTPLKLILLLASWNLAYGAQYNMPEYDVFRYKCPDRCICVPDVVDTHQLVMTCEFGSLDGGITFASFPANATKTLTIRCGTQDGGTSRFADDMFEGFRQLRDLRIADCTTTSIPINVFRGLSNLKSLTLSRLGDNANLAGSMFEPVAALEKLTFTETAMPEVPDKLFCPLGGHLQILNLTGNALTRARLGACPLKQLLILDLSNNAIKAFAADDLNAYPALRQLTADGNHLSELHPDAFRLVGVLQRLDLERNDLAQIVELPAGLLHLNLAHNKLTMIPAAVAKLNRLVSLNLKGNSIKDDTPFSLTAESLETLDLSDNKLTAVPLKVFQLSQGSLLYLYLSGNQIAVLQPNGLSNLTRLQKLDLSSNSLKTLPNDVFAGLTDLIELHLSKNNIYDIEVGVFDDISRRLTRLDLASNMLVELPIAVRRLTKLKSLDLRDNHIKKVQAHVLSKLPHINRLDFSGNKLSSIDSYVFADCLRLNELDLSRNRINSLAADAFEKCPHLKAIDLSQNSLSGFDQALKAVRSLRTVNASFNGLTDLKWAELPDELLFLDVSGNEIKKLDKASKSNVKRVNLGNNKLTLLETGTLPESIEYLNLDNNEIAKIGQNAIVSLPVLKSVDLSHNKLKNLNSTTFRDSESSMISGLLTTHVKLAGNPLSCDCGLAWIASLSGSTSLQIIDSEAATCIHQVSKLPRSLNSLEAEDYLCKYKEACEPSCICCKFGNCDCNSKCPQGCTCFHDASHKTNIVQCKNLDATAGKAFKPQAVPMHATHVFLEGLNLPKLSSNAFMSRVKLTELRINDCGVGFINSSTFNALPSLKVLDLSKNSLTTVRGDEINKSQRIEKVDLSGNKIDKIGVKLLDQVPNLVDVDLSGNNFNKIPAFVTELKPETLIHLGRNPFRCDCDYTRFTAQTWIPANIDRVQDVDDLECVENVTSSFLSNDSTVLTGQEPNRGEHLHAMKMLDFLANANSTICAIEAGGIFGGGPERNVVLITAAAIFAFFAIAGLILVLFAFARSARGGRHRYQKATPSLNCSTGTPGTSPLPVFPCLQYDAFISYSKADEPSIMDWLVRPLENDDYQLCLLHQGQGAHAYHNNVHSINDHLINQMESAQVLILVLTRNFLENEWRTLQIKTSHQLFAKLQNKYIIAVLSDDVHPNDLDDELGQILRKNRCLRRADPLFWSLLRSALPMKLELRQMSSGSTILGDGSDIYSEMYGVVPSEVV